MRPRIFRLRYLLAERIYPTAQLKHDRLLAEQIMLTEQATRHTREQGPLLIKAVIDAVSGGIGGKVGLGTKGPGRGPLSRL